MVPAVILLLAVCLATLQVGVQQLRVQDAAAVAARVEARGDGGSAAIVSELVPGASLSLVTRGALLCATVGDAVTVAGVTLGGVRIRGESCAPTVDEPGTG
ncbi:MAG: hypothetical protein RI885_1023 [Actinomycetota bacterium]